MLVPSGDEVKGWTLVSTIPASTIANLIAPVAPATNPVDPCHILGGKPTTTKKLKDLISVIGSNSINMSNSHVIFVLT